MHVCYMWHVACISQKNSVASFDSSLSRLRNRVFEALLRQEVGFFDEHTSGALALANLLV